MEFLVELWQPIVLSAVLVFVVSSVIHMATPMHKSDYRRLPGEPNVLSTMRGEAIPPGDYMFPFCDSMKEMGSEEMVKKFNEGPVGFMTVRPNGMMQMGSSLFAWFLYSLVISVFAGYVTRVAYEPGADYMAVFRLSGTVAVLAYATAHIPNSIWKGVCWGTSFRFLIDGVLYGLVTAGAFGWLWPGLA